MVLPVPGLHAVLFPNSAATHAEHPGGRPASGSAPVDGRDRGLAGPLHEGRERWAARGELPLHAP
eukprot:4554292-Alexandrium_andersonii.AAC.1